MRTKTLLLTAAITAAGLATSMAQAVYSVNMVGYINLNIAPGYSMVANQLVAPSMTVDALFPTAPSGFGFFKLQADGSGYDSAEVISGPGEPTLWEYTGPVLSLPPGEGGWIFNPGTTPVTATLVGEVQLTSTVQLPAGYSIRSTVVPQAAALSAVHGFPRTVAGTGVSRKRVGAPGYDSYELLDLGSPGAPDIQWDPSDPEPRVGESFFVFNPSTSAQSWSRTFPVGP